MTRSKLQRERYYRLPRTRSYNGNLCRKLNKQKKPAPEMTPGRALLCLRKPKTLEYQGFQAKRKCTVILSKLPCIGGCGGGIWTHDRRVMGPTSYRTAPLRDIGSLELIYNTTTGTPSQYPDCDFLPDRLRQRPLRRSDNLFIYFITVFYCKTHGNLI